MENKFLKLLELIGGFFSSIYRSFIMFIFPNKKYKTNLFFKAIDYFFYSWPKYFWKKPTGFKIGNFLGDWIKYIFYIKK
ncbi:MAG: hypothetical protein NWP80_02005 [Candidatus Gracilibacteria bacterium]|nr:hypothetical protein [Candidatus Gracilibacteria bacterium]